jgi:hypothetical protein
VRGKQKVMQIREFEEFESMMEKTHDMIAFFLYLNDGSVACKQ